MIRLFAGLHRHSHYSKRDAIAKIPDIVNRIGELGQNAWALTDHGTTSGLMEAYKYTQKYNKENNTHIKFIFGCEAYWIPSVHIKDRKASCHILLLAKNQAGYRNLLRLVTRGYGERGERQDNFFYTMRITTDDLKEFSEGLVVTSACRGGILNPSLEDGSWDRKLAWERASEFKSLFGSDFYLEIQSATDPEQEEYNRHIIWASDELNIPVIVTEDSHYVYKQEADVHRKWLGLSDEDTYYPTDDYYIHSEQEVRDSLSYFSPDLVDKLIDNTVALADSIEEVHIEFGVNHYPKVNIPKKYDSNLDYIKSIINDGWRKKIVGKIDKNLYGKYKEQVRHEVDVLEQVGYTDYMLMTYDFIHALHKKKIRTGVGRGSVGGSLAAYLMGITRIDPIKYGLIFERFANPFRQTSADVDTDVPNQRRDEAIRYLVDKYKNVYHVRTFGLMAERAAIQRAAKSLGYKPSDVKNLPKTIEEQQDAELKDLSTSYLGVIQHFGVHASAILIFPSDPTEWCAIEKQGDDYVCAYEYHDLEAMGLLKEDVLGIKTLDAIDGCVRLIKERHNISLDVDNLPDTDEKTFEMLNNDDVLGCFQIESAGMRKIIQGIKPNSVYDIVPLVALYRPSTIQSGKVDEFIESRKNQNVKYIDEKLKDVLSETYGVMLYQEQAMKIVQVMAGYSLGEADVFRRAIGRKIPEEMERLVPKFVKDCEARGTSEKVAEELAEWLSNAAGYQFNKSHSAAYGYTCYQTAYLKAHYPAEYLCAYLNAYKGDKQEELLVYINDAKHHGIKTIPASVEANTCDWRLTHQGSLIMALNYIAGIGDIPVPLNKYTYKKLPKNKQENLIKAGALDRFGKREELLKELYENGELAKLQNKLVRYNEMAQKQMKIRDTAKDGTKKKEEAQRKLTKYCDIQWDIVQKIQEMKSTAKDSYDRTAGEIEVLGMTFSDPFDGYDLSKYKEPQTDESGKILENSKEQRVVIGIVRKIKHWKQKNGKPMMFFTLECPSGKSYDMVMFNYCYTNLVENKVYEMVIMGNKFKRLI